MLGHRRLAVNPIARWRLFLLERRLAKTQQRYIFHALNNNTAELCHLISEIALLSNEKARYEGVPEAELDAETPLLELEPDGRELSLRDFIGEVYTVIYQSNLQCREVRRPDGRRRVLRQGMHELRRVLETCGNSART